MTDLTDLDSLERLWKSADHYGFIETLYQEFPALIQRLRAAEYDRDVIAPSNAADTESVFEINRKLQARIAQLERVRDAASWYQICRDRVKNRVRVTGMDEAREGLRAALAAVEEIA